MIANPFHHFPECLAEASRAIREANEAVEAFGRAARRLMDVTFEHVVDGVECTVYASQFTSDPDVGISFGPEEIWAVSIDTERDVDIPEDEIGNLVELAIDAYYAREEDLLI